MKVVKRSIYFFTAIVCLTSCDKGFVEVNTNPYALTSINPGLLFSNAQQLTHAGSLEGEQTVVQQFVNAYNTGATAGFNFNEDNNNFNITRWNESYERPIKLIEQIFALTKNDPARSNLYNQARIWRAFVYMGLVDTYGDVPYSQAGKAFLEGTFYPKYDRDQAIYEDLYAELKAATAALDPAKDYVREDMLYGPTGSATQQAAQWKKLGNSLLLRLGMRYSKLDANKAKSIVVEAFNGGVMQTNTDNALLVYNSTYNNPLNVTARTQNPYFYYLAEPFVNFLKTNVDPRLKYIAGKYADPNQVLALTPDTTAANQFGFPVGYDQTTVPKYPGYRGAQGTGQNYSQLNYSVVGSAVAPVFYVTNAQTKLLLAEAAFRGWLTGTSGALTAQQYYEAGVRAAMDDFSKYPNVSNPAIPANSQTSYLTRPGVAYSESRALELINTQYWVASFGNGGEAFANFRRSGFPTLKPNAYNNSLQGGFVRRFAYPNDESSRNSVNYQEAVTRMGPDNLTTRVFWDKP